MRKAGAAEGLATAARTNGGSCGSWRGTVATRAKEREGGRSVPTRSLRGPATGAGGDQYSARRLAIAGFLTDRQCDGWAIDVDERPFVAVPIKGELEQSSAPVGEQLAERMFDECRI